MTVVFYVNIFRRKQEKQLCESSTSLVACGFIAKLETSPTVAFDLAHTRCVVTTVENEKWRGWHRPHLHGNRANTRGFAGSFFIKPLKLLRTHKLKY